MLKRGDTVILDNLNVHEVTGMREAIEAAGARILYRPAYYPIEQAFAKLKALQRIAAARTVSDLWQAIRNAFAAYSTANAETTSPPQDTACDPT